MSLFKDKTLMITGGTGSFGNAVLNRFLKTDIGEHWCLSPLRSYCKNVTKILLYILSIPW